MRSEVEGLIQAVLDEADVLDDLVDIVREQRDAVKDRASDEVDELMKELHNAFFDAQTAESLRDTQARKLAARLGCGPQSSSLSSRLEEDERPLFKGATDRLSRSVFQLKSEMRILTGLIEQNERYASMLVSECSRLMGDVSQAGTTDFRG